MVRWVYELRSQDDDFGQAGTLIREIWNHALRAEFVANVTGRLLGSVRGEVLETAFDYWRNVDADTGKLIKANVRAANGA
jgi:catalase